MTTSFRLAATLALIHFMGPTSHAQLPAAPEPHPTLDELVREYRRCGLPIHPPEAELVRVTLYPTDDHPYALAFRYPPAKDGEAPRYRVGYSWHWHITSKDVSLVKPESNALIGVNGWNSYWLILAVQCRLRGWDDLAVAAYAEGRKATTQAGVEGKEPPSVYSCLHATAWGFWTSRLADRETDRKEAWARLSYLANADPTGVSWRDQSLLDELKLTIAPRKSKPGTIEALIDDLTEYWDDLEDGENGAGDRAYWKLVELGFDSVPALMQHVEDRRLTRAERGPPPTGLPLTHILRVGDIVEHILDGFSGGMYGNEAYALPASEIVPAKEHKWWAKARRVGEVQWLVDHALPEGDAEGEPPLPNETILRVIRIKYPSRLKEVYQTALFKSPRRNTELITKAIVAGSLPREQKIALLVQGATQKVYSHRHHALEALAELDYAAFREHLLLSLKSIPVDIAFAQDAYNPEVWIVGMLRKADDRECWDALAALSRRVTPGTRHHLINGVGWWVGPDEADPGRRECLRYLIGFLDDPAVGEVPWHGPQAVRDFTTTRLALVLGVAERKSLESLRSPREISLLRESVRELAERELARPMK